VQSTPAAARATALRAQPGALLHATACQERSVLERAPRTCGRPVEFERRAADLLPGDGGVVDREGRVL
jgi:hypothetical protein